MVRTTPGQGRYADKTPMYVNVLPVLAGAFPEARFVHIIRDGRNVPLAYMNVPLGPMGLVDATLYWKRNVERGRRAGPRLGPERYREVRYEQLIDESNRVFAELCPFLDLEFDPAMLRYFERADRVLAPIDNPQHHRGLSMPVTKGMRDWRTGMDPKDVCAFEVLAGDVLTATGYEHSGEQASPRVRSSVQAAKARMQAGCLAHRLGNVCATGRATPLPIARGSLSLGSTSRHWERRVGPGRRRSRMDFGWSETQDRYRDEVIAFAQREFNDDVVRRDADAEALPRCLEEVCRLRDPGIGRPRGVRGSWRRPAHAVMAMEALGYGCTDNGLLFSLGAQMWSAEAPLVRFGSEEQKGRYLPGLCDGSIIGIQAMTEPGSGSDAFSLTTTAEKRGDRYVLNGTKTYITNAPMADVILAFVTTEPTKGFLALSAALVDRRTPGSPSAPHSTRWACAPFP